MIQKCEAAVCADAGRVKYSKVHVVLQYTNLCCTALTAVCMLENTIHSNVPDKGCATDHEYPRLVDADYACEPFTCNTLRYCRTPVAFNPRKQKLRITGSGTVFQGVIVATCCFFYLFAIRRT